MDLFTAVPGKLFWDILHHEINSYFQRNRVDYKLIFGKCMKIMITKVIENKILLYTTNDLTS